MVKSERSETAASIRFGTSGWRGILGEEVTFPNLRALVRATARWFEERAAGGRVLVGYDTRFASEPMARVVSQVLAQEGLRPVLSTGPIPTPVLTHAILRRRAAGGLMLTASHNPPAYHGLKVFGSGGGCIVDSEARRLEAWVRGMPAASAREPAATTAVDFASSYRRDLLALLDRERLRRARLRVCYDAMHGVGAGVLDAVLRSAGVEVEVLRGAPDARFGGGVPDPVPERLGGLVSRLRRRGGPGLGLATDGDADRLGVVLAGGRVVSETQVIALLVDHLARSGRARRGVVISRATGSLVGKVASHHGLEVGRLPLGFKHLSVALQSGVADIAGEESGGFALARMGRDKDGILAGCLLSELAASVGGDLRVRLAELEKRFGRSSCGRCAIPADASLQRALDRLTSEPPDRIGDAVVRESSREDGLWLGLDDGFVLLRRSGTEPVLRIYAEARGPRQLVGRMRAGETLLRRLAAEAAG